MTGGPSRRRRTSSTTAAADCRAASGSFALAMSSAIIGMIAGQRSRASTLDPSLLPTSDTNRTPAAATTCCYFTVTAASPWWHHTRTIHPRRSKTRADPSVTRQMLGAGAIGGRPLTATKSCPGAASLSPRGLQRPPNGSMSAAAASPRLPARNGRNTNIPPANCAGTAAPLTRPPGFGC